MNAALSFPDWLTTDRILIGVAALVVLVVIGRVRRSMRRRRPVRLNPKLAKYGEPNQAAVQADMEASRKIIATSSTEAVAGYRIVQQIEAVFIDGCRTPDDAVAALKASAGRRGANALINLRQQRTAAGRCTAQGDAVVVKLAAEK